MINSILLISVVRRGRADRVVELAREAGARGSTVLFGRGTAKNVWLRYLGLADTEKELVFTITGQTQMTAVVNALRASPDLCKRTPGIGFTLDLNCFLHSGAAMRDTATEADAIVAAVNNMHEHELICVIANSGYADDIMQAAREAGATGGTIIRARGTGTEKDCGFFGITIVPEKEMLMILVRREAKESIMNAVRACPCLSEPGVGIVFSLPVQSFFPLGAKANS